MLALCAAIQYAQWPLGRTGAFPLAESGAYALAGRLLLQGETPYVDFIANTPPLIFLIEAGVLWLSNGQLGGLWVASWLGFSATVLLVAAACRRWYGAALGALVAVALAATLHPLLEGGNLTETYALPLQATALFLAVRAVERGRELPTAAALGALSALCLLLRANLVGAGIATLLWILLVYPARRARLIGAAAGGAAFVLMLGLGYLSVAGALDGYVEHSLLYDLADLQTTWRGRAREGLTMVVDAGGPLAPFAWLGVAAAMLRARRLGRQDGPPAAEPTVFIALWFLVEIILVTIWGRRSLSYHCEGPIALVGSLGLAHGLSLGREALTSAPRVRGVLSPRAAGLILTLLLGMVVALKSRRDLQTLDYPDFFPYWRAENAAVEALHRHSAAGEPVLVWGFAPGVYLRAGRDPVSPYIHSYPLLKRNWASPAAVESFSRNLRTARPSVIIDAFSGTPNSLIAALQPGEGPGPFDRLWPPPELKPAAEWVRANYRPIGEIGPWKWQVYVWRGTGG